MISCYLVELVEYYSVGSVEYDNCRQASLSVTTLLNSLRAIIAELENTEKLIELQEDISGVQELVHQGRVCSQAIYKSLD